MARPLRIEFAGALYHVTARGNAQQDIYADDADRRQFLDLLGHTVNRQAGAGVTARQGLGSGLTFDIWIK